MLSVIVAVVFGSASAAWAHASVVSTVPGDGSVLGTPPAGVSVVFDQPVQAVFGTLRVFAPDGSRVDVGAASHPAGHADTVTIAIGAKGGLRPGTYTVAWRIVSADSHPVTGGFTFSIGISSAVKVDQANLAPTGSRTVGILFGAARWSAYAGFALLSGVVVFVTCCWRNGFGHRRLRRLLAASWTLFVAATAGCLALQGPYGAGGGIGDALSGTLIVDTIHTRLGRALLARLILLVLAAPLLVWTTRRLPRMSGRERLGLALLGGVFILATAATWAVSDHASTGFQVPVAVPMEMLHLIAMAFWLGGLVALAAVLLPLGESADVDGGQPVVAEIVEAVPRFSTLAFDSVLTLAATGTYSTWRAAGTLPALADTPYGRLLLGKIAGFCLMAGLGAAARHWVARHARSGRSLPAWPRRGGPKTPTPPGAEDITRLRSSVAIEVAVGVSVLALTAVLVEAQPARAAYSPPIHASMRFDTKGPHGAGTLELGIDPAKVGYNTIHLDVLDPGGRPEQVPEVDAGFLLPARQLGPLPVQLVYTGTGHYIATTPVAVAGAWQLRVTVRTDDINETTVTFLAKVR